MKYYTLPLNTIEGSKLFRFLYETEFGKIVRESGSLVAGGSILRALTGNETEESDIDIFPMTEVNHMFLDLYIFIHPLVYLRYHKNSNRRFQQVVPYEYPESGMNLQICSFHIVSDNCGFEKRAGNLFQSFDFNIAKVCVFRDKIFISEEAYHDMKNKVLTASASHKKHTTLDRVNKYIHTYGLKITRSVIEQQSAITKAGSFYEGR